MSTPVFYLFHGDDDLGMEAEVAGMVARMGANGDLNTSRFDGTQTPVSEIMGAALAFPFLSDKRLVIVKDLLSWITRKGAGESGKKAVELLLNELPNLADWARLVLVERDKLPESSKVLKWAHNNPRAYVKLFSAPADSTEWIIKRAHDAYNVGIEPAAAAALAAVTPGDLRRADNELLKLAAYTDGRTITEDDVAVMTPYVTEANMFAMADALAEGRADRAAALLHRLLEQEEDIFGVYGMIVRQFRLMLLTREALDAGRKPAEALADFGVKSSFQIDKLTKQARAFTLAQLETVYKRLRDYDRDMKTGRIEPLLALDVLIASLGREKA
jgi:DNA polymerase-3 subunit delta